MPRPDPYSTMITTLFFTAAAVAACETSTTEPQYDPDIPTSWAPAVTNSFLPWTPGRTYTYGGAEDVTIEVLATTKVISGVTAVEVRDRVYESGELVEDTYDWYAQDGDGNVWYLGEDTKEYEDGVVVSTEGSWEWGQDGALPGIVMWADPAAHEGESYRQEYRKDVAEDWGLVIATDVSVTVPAGSYTGCVRTLDTSGLDRFAREHKTYCPGVGLVLETQEDGSDPVELLSVTP